MFLFIRWVLFLSLFLYANIGYSHFHWDIKECFKKTTVRAALRLKHIGSSLASSKGGWLFFKDESPHDLDQFLLGRFLEKPAGGRFYYHPLKKLTDFFPHSASPYLNADVHIVDGIFYNVFDRPASAVSRRFGGGNKKLRIPWVIAVSLSPPFTYVWRLYESSADDQLKEKFETILEEDKSNLENALNFDYRYNEIRKKLVAKEITKEEALKQVYFLGLSIKNYYTYMIEYAPDDDESTIQKNLLSHQLFSHIKKMIDEGVPAPKGYLKSATYTSKLSQAQIQKLIGINQLLYSKYEIIPEVVAQSEEYKKMKADKDLKRIISAIEEDRFYKILTQAKKEGLLSSHQIQFALQEDAAWLNRFQQWETVGLTRLKVVGDQLTSQPLTLEDIRQETYQELGIEKIAVKFY